MVARVVWDHEAAGSSPVTSIEENHLRTRVFRWFLFVVPQLIPHLRQPRRGTSPRQEKRRLFVACNSDGSLTFWKFAWFAREGWGQSGVIAPIRAAFGLNCLRFRTVFFMQAIFLGRFLQISILGGLVFLWLHSATFLNLLCSRFCSSSLFLQCFTKISAICFSARACCHRE